MSLVGATTNRLLDFPRSPILNAGKAGFQKLKDNAVPVLTSGYVASQLMGPSAALAEELKTNNSNNNRAAVVRPATQDELNGRVQVAVNNIPKSSSRIEDKAANVELVKILNTKIDRATAIRILKSENDFPILDVRGNHQFDDETNKLKVDQKAYRGYRAKVLDTALKFGTPGDFGSFLLGLMHASKDGKITNTQKHEIIDLANTNTEKAVELAKTAYGAVVQEHTDPRFHNWLNDQLVAYRTN